MKIVTVVVVFVMMIFIGGRSWGQNLAGNGSFEDTVYCPQHWDSISACFDWHSGYQSGTSPNYFNTCSSNPDVSPPNVVWGYQVPHSGNSYCCVATFLNFYPFNLREVIQSTLISPLTIGQKYFVSFYASFLGTGTSTIATNKLGALFTTYPFTPLNPAAPNNFAQIYADSILTDTTNWSQVKGEFIADSAYQYIALGNFFDNDHTDTIVLGTYFPCCGGYYLDDVCVSIDSLDCFTTGIQSVNSQSTFSLSPNPVQNLLTLVLSSFSEGGINFLSPSALASGETIVVYDVAGRKIVLPTAYSNNKAELTTTTLTNGIYLLQVINSITGMSEVGKFVKE